MVFLYSSRLKILFVPFISPSFAFPTCIIRSKGHCSVRRSPKLLPGTQCCLSDNSLATNFPCVLETLKDGAAFLVVCMKWAIQKLCRKQRINLWQSANTEMRFLCSAHQEQNRQQFHPPPHPPIGGFSPQMIDYDLVLLLTDKTQFLCV